MDSDRPISLKHDQRLLHCFALIADMDTGAQGSTIELVEQFHHTHDPDAFATFVRWRECHALEILLLLAAKLTDDEVDEVIETVEDIVRQRTALARAPVSADADFSGSHTDEE